jgi:uncharacterized membrane protein (DUF485 family)
MQVPESDAIVARPLLAAAFCGIIIVGYFVFILLVTDAKPLMGVMLWPGIRVGITTAALLLVLCIVLSAVFVVVADRNEKQS